MSKIHTELLAHCSQLQISGMPGVLERRMLAELHKIERLSRSRTAAWQITAIATTYRQAMTFFLCFLKQHSHIIHFVSRMQ
jgi:hypothetical protein